MYVGTVYDSITETYFWVVDDTAGGNLFASSAIEDTPLMPMLEQRNNPFALSLDWIGRSLYWVEGVSFKTRLAGILCVLSICDAILPM